MSDDPFGEFRGGDERPGDSAAEMLGKLLGGPDGDLDEIADAAAPPVHWPTLDADEYAEELRGLYVWSTGLQHRYTEMVRLPRCWHRHNGLVELLGALRDHERASYATTAAPGAALSWQMGFRDAEARLKVWIADLRCGGDPNYHDQSVHTATAPARGIPEDVEDWIKQTKQIRQGGLPPWEG